MPEDSSDTSTVSSSLVHQSAIQNCETPVEQFARFSEEGVARGLTDVIPTTERENGGRKSIGRGGSVVASDLDADGDIDLLFHPFLSDPMVYINDGTGHFSPSSAVFLSEPGLYMGGVNAAGATDLNGDFVPEILVASAGYAGIYWSEDNTWLPMETLHRDDRPTRFLPTDFASYLTLSLGDIDGDNDLDLVLPGTGSLVDGESHLSGGPDRILENQENGFEFILDLISEDIGSRTMVALFTDHDADGDMDLFVPADRGPPSALWTNQGTDSDGAVTWKNTASTLQADLEMAAMGIDGADLNEDGQLDYCITDRARPRCLLSAPDGTYYEAGQAMGVTTDEPANERFTTTGWSIDFADLDNDGVLDLFQSSGAEGEALELELGNYADLIWRGVGETQFQDVSAESGLGSTGNHYGHAIADFDGNGWLDIVVAGPMLQPQLFMAACGSAHWLSLDLVGPANNTEAIGARVEAQLSLRSDVREISSLRAQGQNPSLLHYGLGTSDTLERLTVHWPDGSTETLQDLSANHHYTLVHPNAANPPWLEQ